VGRGDQGVTWLHGPRSVERSWPYVLEAEADSMFPGRVLLDSCRSRRPWSERKRSQLEQSGYPFARIVRVALAQSLEFSDSVEFSSGQHWLDRPDTRAVFITLHCCEPTVRPLTAETEKINVQIYGQAGEKWTGMVPLHGVSQGWRVGPFQLPGSLFAQQRTVTAELILRGIAHPGPRLNLRVAPIDPYLTGRAELFRRDSFI